MRNKNFESVYAENIEGFLSLKKHRGFKYKRQIKAFTIIDRLAVQNGEKGPGLTKEFFNKWLDYNPNQSPSTRYDKCSLLRQFSNYLIDLDIESYLPRLPRYPGRRDIAYIYTSTEISEIFKASNELRLVFNTTSGLFCFPAIIRFLYATGVRIGEVLSLKNEDVNLLGKYVKIKDGKNRHERLLPISDSLVDVLSTFLWYKKQLVISEENDLFFTKTDGSKISSVLIGEYFKRCLETVKIYGDDKHRRPRVHDLRHTFAVNALVKIVETGNDAYVALPILSKYLGHRSISATNIYVKLTAQLFPAVVKNLELYLIDVFPKKM